MDFGKFLGAFGQNAGGQLGQWAGGGGALGGALGGLGGMSGLGMAGGPMSGMGLLGMFLPQLMGRKKRQGDDEGAPMSPEMQGMYPGVDPSILGGGQGGGYSPQGGYGAGDFMPGKSGKYPNFMNGFGGMGG